MITNKYSKEEIKKAREIVTYVDERQAKLSKLALKLKKRVSKFKDYKFEYDGNTTRFSGVRLSTELVTSKAVCKYTDYPNKIFGEYIAVSRALKMNYNDVYELIEIYASKKIFGDECDECEECEPVSKKRKSKKRKSYNSHEDEDSWDM